MSGFETVSCDNCGDEFKVHPSAAAAETGYCSPACETAGEVLV